MGSKLCREESITTQYKKDTLIKTILKTNKYRISFQMRADKDEFRNLQIMWKDFISGARNTFIFNNTTKFPQEIKFLRLSDGSLQFSTSTTVNIDEDELKSFSKMFDTISKNIDSYNKPVSAGLTINDNNNSSTNLLVVN
jgi:hypothetical protein